DIYPDGRNEPETYYNYVNSAESVTYDESGNVFIAGLIGQYKSRVAWLRSGSSRVRRLRMSPPPGNLRAGVEWDGKDLAAENLDGQILRYRITDQHAKLDRKSVV